MATTTTTPAPTTAPPPTTTTTTTTVPPMTTASTMPPTTAPITITTVPTTTTARVTMSGNGSSPLPPQGNNTSVPTTISTILTTITATTTASFSSVTNQLSSTTATNISVAFGQNLPVLLCDNPDVICIFNPDENATGPLQIDPRLGTTPASAAALQGPQIIGYNGQVSSFDTAVKFPRERRSINYKQLQQENNRNFYNRGEHKIHKRQSCRCVAVGTCVRTSSGAGMIDFRIVTPTTAPCPAGQEYCCGSTTTALIACGTLQTSPSPAIMPAAGQANFGEYPWQVIILTKQNDYIAGGVLIDQLNVLTVTHRMSNYIVSGTAPNVKVRLGEWDAAGTYEPVPFQEYNVSRVFTHPSYNSNTLQYDITVLRLSASVPLTPQIGSATTINRACLPPISTSTYTGQRCWVSGWGKDMFGLQGQYQQILKKVDVLIVDSATCQTQMQNARLGSTFVLDTTSFICAGGEANKDSCTGDGGSGLVCQVNGQWVVVGLVAWGLGCASANVPAAYVNIAALLPWIQQQVATT
ncbi:unnamed protein product [Euphydryas editha]|nr:unnamed protein product [Euphydryas editha]